MLSSHIIISVCVLLLLAYIFDLTSHKTKIPSVILLLLLGWSVKGITELFDINIADLSSILPVLGTIGLILIVLEGALELELTKSSIPLIRKSLIMALIPLFILAFGIGLAFHFYGGYSMKISLTNAIPFCVISSAIAIPSVSNWSKTDKTFVIYESSLSDIIGVVFFNFIALNIFFTFGTYLHFFLNIVIVLLISFIATVGLSYILSRLNHRIKFGPILIIIVLIYAVSKLYHLPALLFIMIFGLSIGNIDKLKDYKWLRHFKPEKLKKEVLQFREIVVEATFLIRTMFFLLFGFLIKTNEILNPETVVWALGIVGGIIIVRIIVLAFLKLSIPKFMFIAPRGLITILLFFSILPENSIPIVNKSLVIQVIVISVIIMMIGILFTKKSKEDIEAAIDNEDVILNEGGIIP